MNRPLVGRIERTIGDPCQGVDRAIENDGRWRIQKGESLLEGEIGPFKIGITLFSFRWVILPPSSRWHPCRPTFLETYAAQH